MFHSAAGVDCLKKSDLSRPELCRFHLTQPCYRRRRYGLRMTDPSCPAPPPRQIWVQVPLISPAATQRQYRSDLPTSPAPEKSTDVEDDPWLWWDRLRNATGTEARLGVCLQVGADLPESRRLDRWMGEPVKCVMLSADVFINNKVGRCGEAWGRYRLGCWVRGGISSVVWVYCIEGYRGIDARG